MGNPKKKKKKKSSKSGISVIGALRAVGVSLGRLGRWAGLISLLLQSSMRIQQLLISAGHPQRTYWLCGSMVAYRGLGLLPQTTIITLDPNDYCRPPFKGLNTLQGTLFCAFYSYYASVEDNLLPIAGGTLALWPSAVLCRRLLYSCPIYLCHSDQV